MTWLTALGARFGIYAAVALILIGLGAGTCWYFVADRIAKLQADRKELTSQLARAASARKVEQQISQQRAATRQKRAAEGASSAAKDAAALDANPQWAATPLPKEIRDALAE